MGEGDRKKASGREGESKRERERERERVKEREREICTSQVRIITSDPRYNILLRICRMYDNNLYTGDKIQKKMTTRMGFEPTRAEHNGLAVHRLNHSATLS